MKIEKKIIAFFIIGIVLNPIFFNLGIPAYWPSTLALFLLILFKHIELLFKPINLVALIFLLILYTYNIETVYSDIHFPLGNFSIFIPFFLVGLIQELINKDKSHELVKFVGKISFYSISLLSLFTIISLLRNPLSVRSVFSAEAADSITHSFVGIYFLPFFVVIPILLNRLDTSLFHKVLISLSLIVLLTAGLSTAILMLAISSISAIILKYRKKSFFFKSIIFSFFLSIVFIYQYVIDKVVELLPKELQSDKKHEIENISYESMDSFLQTYRGGVYNDSFQSFIHSPFLGKQGLEFGQHSSVIDKLGLFGLSGTILFFLLYYLLYRNSFKFGKSVLVIKYLNISFFVLFISMIFNPLDIYYMQFYYLFFLIFPCVVNYLFTSKDLNK